MMRGWADSGCDSGHGCLRAGKVSRGTAGEGPAVGGGVADRDRRGALREFKAVLESLSNSARNASSASASGRGAELPANLPGRLIQRTRLCSSNYGSMSDLVIMCKSA
jgi:hypothetical protein